MQTTLHSNDNTQGNHVNPAKMLHQITFLQQQDSRTNFVQELCKNSGTRQVNNLDKESQPRIQKNSKNPKGKIITLTQIFFWQIMAVVSYFFLLILCCHQWPSSWLLVVTFHPYSPLLPTSKSKMVKGWLVVFLILL